MILKILTFGLGFFSTITAFVHPGVLINQQQLDYMKTQTLAGVEPFATAYTQAKGSRWGSLTYTPLGPPSTIQCGSYSQPDKGCTTENSDSEAALTQALLWYISGNKQYASNAIKILDAYATKLTGGHTDSNAPLQSGWATQKFPAAAEIIYYTNAGWPQANFKAYQNSLKTQYLPAMNTPTPNDNGNWAMSIVSGKLGIAVVTEDQALFDSALAQLKEIIPSYFYSFKEDGTTPKKSSLVSPKWNDKHLVFGPAIDGICQETCRDFQHLQFGLASCFNGLETAYIQGRDLYPQLANRLTTMMEFHTKLIPTGFSSLKAGGVKTKVDKAICGGKISLTVNPTFEVAYNAYHNRLGYSLPSTWNYLANSVRKIDYTGFMSALDHTSTFETLHHGNGTATVLHIVELEKEL